MEEVSKWIKVMKTQSRVSNLIVMELILIQKKEKTKDYVAWHKKKEANKGSADFAKDVERVI